MYRHNNTELHICFPEPPTRGSNKSSRNDWVPSGCLSASPLLLWAHLAQFWSRQCILFVALRPECPSATVWREVMSYWRGVRKEKSGQVHAKQKQNLCQEGYIADCEVNKLEAPRPYPNFFIFPLHRLLQVGYFSNKTLLFHTQLTDLLSSPKRK